LDKEPQFHGERWGAYEAARSTGTNQSGIDEFTARAVHGLTMSLQSHSLATRGLQKLADWVFKYPRIFAYSQLLLAVVCGIYTVQNLKFNTSRSDLVGKDKKYHQNFLRYRQEFPNQDDLVVVVESESQEKNRRFVELLGARLEAETNLFTDIFYKGDLKMMGRKALLFLDKADLVALGQKLKDYRPFIQNFTTATNLDGLFQLINRQFRTAKQEQNAENESLIKALPALERIISLAESSLSQPGTPLSPGITALFGAGDEAESEMYVTEAKGLLYLVTAHARTEEQNPAAVLRMRELVRQVQEEVPGVNIGFTGEPVLELDEMAQSQTDTTVATVVSLIIVMLIFIYGYQETGRPIKATFCLIIGLIYTMAFATLTVGYLNILTITFLPMLVGLAIDFGVHLISRYEEELRHGKSERQALEKAMVYTGLGIFTGCFTTAAAFLAMGATRFKGIQEMGIISGGGLLVCLVPMMTLLPVLLMRGRQNVLDHQIHANDRRSRIEQLWLNRPWMTVGVTLVLSVVALTQFSKVYFDYNLLNMQSKGLPAVRTEKKLLYSGTNSVLFGAVIANSLEEAVRLEAQLTNLPVVARVRSMSSFMANRDLSKLDIIGEIKKELATINFAPIDFKPVNLEALDQTLWSFHGYLGLAGNEVRKEGDAALEKQLGSIRQAVESLRESMLRMDRDLAASKLAAYQQALLSDIRETFEALRNQDNSGPLQAQDLPVALRNRFIGQTGKFLLQVYPRKDVWQRANQEEFVCTLRQMLDPKDTNHPIITGTPVQLYEYTSLLKNSYEEAAWYSLVTIAVLVFIHFRQITCVVLALLPVGVGTIWLVGLMGWFDVPFNPANIMTLPLVIGIGVTSGIHILNRFAEEQNPGILAKSTGLAVFISALTTVAGFGSLILAKHQGIQSLGYVMAVGTTTCMVAALTVLPALLTLMIRWGWPILKPKANTPAA
jgi:uncharacterized protein